MTSWAAWLVTDLVGLVTTTVQEPVSDDCALAMASVLDVAPGVLPPSVRFTLFFRHC